ncbi:hypothetical protein FIBSPDRAFT_726364, partial [Athelia psychrophila]
LAPKSELMIYIGMADDNKKAYKFMCLPNNVIFAGTTALFDETLFPKCPDHKQRTFTHIGENPNDIPLEVRDDDDDVYRPNPPKTPQRDVDHGHDDDRERTDPPVPVPPLPPLPPIEPRRSRCERNFVPTPGNIYGEKRNPIEQYKDVEKMGQWKKLVGEQPKTCVKPQEHEPVPGPSSDQPTPSADKALMASLCREGGVELMNFLISKAVPDNSELLPQKSNVREWTYHNIIQLLLVEQKGWKNACREELKSLHE